MKNEEHVKAVTSGKFLMVCSGETYSTEIVDGKNLLERMAVAMFGDNWKTDASKEEIKSYEDELNDPDNWNHDQDRGPTRYSLDVGETDHIQFFLITNNSPSINS